MAGVKQRLKQATRLKKMGGFMGDDGTIQFKAQRDAFGQEVEISEEQLERIRREMSQDIKLGGFSSRSNALEEEDSDEEGGGGGKAGPAGSDIEEEEQEADEEAEFDPEKDVAVDDDPVQIKAALAAKAMAQAAAYQKTWDAGGSLAERIAAEAQLEVSEEDAVELAALLANLGVPETIQNLLGLPIKTAALALAMLVRLHKQQTKIMQVRLGFWSFGWG